MMRKLREIFRFRNHAPAREQSTTAGVERRCSFCNKSQRYVRKLVAGPNVNICDECVDICLDVLAADRIARSACSRGSAVMRTSISLCMEIRSRPRYAAR